MYQLQKRMLFIALLCVAATISVKAQGGNTISGHVFGEGRLPLEGINVELQDDYSRTISRIRTNSTGRYFFSGMSAGVYVVRIMPFGTNFQEQEQRIEIQNITRSDSAGNRVVGAFANEQRDFYLRVDRNKRDIGSNETVFAQEVPDQAKQLYDEGIDLLEKKRTKDGYRKLISAIENFPDYYKAIERLGLEYVQADLFRPASILLQRATEINPKSFRAWYGLAFSFYSLEINKEGLDAAKQASIINPASDDSLLLTGKLLRRAQEFKESEKYLTNAKKLSKNSNPDVIFELALLYGKDMNRLNDAANELELLLKVQPDRKDAEHIKTLINEFRRKSKQT